MLYVFILPVCDAFTSRRSVSVFAIYNINSVSLATQFQKGRNITFITIDNRFRSNFTAIYPNKQARRVYIVHWPEYNRRERDCGA